ncbi:MAG: PAS domain-containing protein [Planctomycetes bacterium]|nr:PAS domain-containing protein [Planctomycetota bacterium]
MSSAATIPTPPPQLPEQNLIARRVLAALIPVLLLCGLGILVVVIVARPELPTRMIPVAVFIGGCLLSWWFNRRLGVRPAGLAILVTLFLAVTVAMSLHGGVRAPAFCGWTILPALAGVIFGRGVAIWCTLSIVVTCAVIELLIARGVLPPAPFAPTIVYLGVLGLTIAVLLVLAILPMRLVRDAAERAELSAMLAAEARSKERIQGETLQALYDNTQSLLGLLDAQGRVLAANASSLAMIGMKLEDVRNQRFSECPWWLPKDRARVEAAIERAAAGESARFQTSHLNNDGRHRVIDFSLSPYRNEAGEVTYLIPEGRDISDLVRAQEQLSHGQRMEALGQLAGGVAHDLNNMLMAIRGSAENLVDRRPDLQGTDVAQMAGNVIAAANRAADLTAKLLAFGRKRKPEAAPLRCDEIVASVLAILDRTIDKSITVETDLWPGPLTVIGDRSALENSVLNLILNARDALPSGGRIVISTRRCVAEDAPTSRPVLPLPEGDLVELAITDNGSGIDPRILGRVFEPFFTTKQEGTGTGLGLPAVFATIRDHGGGLRIESILGKGTSVLAYLPLDKTTPSNQSARPMAHVIESLSGSALVVDDEDLVRGAIDAILGSTGMTVHSFASPAAALEFTRATPNIDIAVVDLVMPGMSGTELAEALRTQLPTLPIVFVSGYPKDQLPGRFGNARLIAKPFGRDQIAQAVAALLPVRSE